MGLEPHRPFYGRHKFKITPLLSGCHHEVIFYFDQLLLALNTTVSLEPSLLMKILSINDFTIKLLSKLLCDLSIRVHLKSSI